MTEVGKVPCVHLGCTLLEFYPLESFYSLLISCSAHLAFLLDIDRMVSQFLWHEALILFTPDSTSGYEKTFFVCTRACAYVINASFFLLKRKYA